MCQYDRRCPIRKHRPGTVCPYRWRGRVVVLGVLSLALGMFFLVIKPDVFESDDAHSGTAVRPVNDGSETGIEVLRVVDGDTLRVRLNGKSERVRLLGIDAPEVSHNGRAAECFGDAATQELTHPRCPTMAAPPSALATRLRKSLAS
jgi:hypothetical protein